MFDNFFASQRPIFAMSQKLWNPPADVYETCEHLVIKMEIAGLRQEDLKIIAEGRTLTVRGLRGEDPDIDKDNIHLMEIRYDRFERVFELPMLLNPDRIGASYHDGFLIVRIPREQPASHQVRIEVSED